MRTNSKIKTYQSYNEIPKAWKQSNRHFGNIKSSALKNQMEMIHSSVGVSAPYDFLKHFYGLTS